MVSFQLLLLGEGLPLLYGLANYGPWTKPGLLCFVSEILLNHGHTSSFTYVSITAISCCKGS